MSKGNDKFNMFEGHDAKVQEPVLSTDTDNEYNDDVEIVSITMKTESRRKMTAAVVTRTQEEYEEFIESTYFETHIHPLTGEEYQVKVTVLKPEINQQELLRPAYAYSTSH